MKNAILKVLPKIAQWEAIPYSAGLHCQCGRADIAYAGWASFKDQYIKPIAIGWCETDYGMMGVFECPECHSKFRCHCGSNSRWSAEDQFALDFETFVRCSANKEEVIAQMKELEKDN